MIQFQDYEESCKALKQLCSRSLKKVTFGTCKTFIYFSEFDAYIKLAALALFIPQLIDFVVVPML